MNISSFAFFAPTQNLISLFPLFSHSLQEEEMNQIPSQQSLDTLRKKRNNSLDTLNRDKRIKDSGYTDCEKSEKSEIRVEIPVELIEAHQRIQRGIVSCRNRRNDNERYQKSHARLVRILSREYLPAIQQLNGLYERQQLITERDALLERLERGWQMDDSPKVSRTFTKVLTRYEVLCDAIDGDVIARHLARVERAVA